MNTDIQAQIQRARQLYQSGAHEEARRLLSGLIRQQPDNGDLWYVAAMIAASQEQKIALLRRTLEVDPFHARAQQALDAATASTRSTPPHSPPAKAAAKLQSPVLMYGAIALLVLVLLGLLGFAVLNMTRSSSAPPAASTRTVSQPAAQVPQATVVLPTPTERPAETTPTLAPTLTPTPAPYHLTATAFRHIDLTEQAALRAEATAAAQSAGG
jgi:hypothetical protein